MAVREILLVDQPILRQKAQKVKRLDPSLSKLIDDMVETMHAANGLGLAAPQVGVGVQLAVVQLPKPAKDDEERLPYAGKLFVLFNPEIVQAEGEETAEEGCLSLPGYVGKVRRAEWVVLKARDRRWREVKYKVDGLLARAFQHEVDHLNGVIYVDRMDDPNELRRVEPGTEEEVEKV